jgi:cytochrome c oxidase subunit 1
MSAITSKEETPSYLGGDYSLKSWLLTGDHKRIAVLYLISVSFFFLIGGLAAGIFRTELIHPKGMFLESDTYNRLFSLHGIVMVFLFLIPAVPAVLGNFLLPIMIGARDLAFPKINLASWYVYTLGGIFVIGAIVGGGVDTGWTFYTPLSSTYANGQVMLAGLGVFVIGFSSIMTGMNFIATVHTMRAPGMTWFRLPLFVWANYATSLVIILGTPVIAITVALLAIERFLGIGIFNPTIGGDPVLFQHLFWFYSHPAVYIMVLPAMGIISELMTCFSRKEIFGYKFVAYSSLGIAALGFLVWGHHMFVTGQSPYAGLVFSFISYLVAVPSAIKVFNWTATLYRGSISFQAPMLFALGFMGLFLIGGLTGLFLANLAVDVHLHDTYFVVAHFHYVMVGGTIMAYLGGIHFWWPKMFGKMYNEAWAKASAILVFVGFNGTFFPQFIMGYMGSPRRYHIYPQEFQIFHILSTAGMVVLGAGYLLPMIYLPVSLFRGKKAPANPWGAFGLEWKTSSPPPTLNFDKTPTVTLEAYDYTSMKSEVTP